MKSTERVFAFLCALVVVLCGIMLALGTGPAIREMVISWIGKKRFDFTGTLTVWHIPGRAMGRGDGSGFLKARLELFEKKNFGVYFALEVLTEQEALQRFAAGEMPDVLSYPSTMQVPIALSALSVEPKNLHSGLLATGKENGEQSAVAYCVGGQVLLINDDALYALPDLLPPGGLPDAAWMANAQATDGFSVVRIGESVSPGIAAAGLESDVMMALLQAPEGVLNDLLDGTAQMAVADLGTLYALQRRAQTELLPGVSAMLFCNAATQVQYISLSADIGASKGEVAAGLVGFLLAAPVQRTLPDNYAFPVRTDLADLLPDDATMALLWEQRRDEKILTVARTDAPTLQAQLTAMLHSGCTPKEILDFVKQKFD